ncbi:MAG: hemolysin family protein [Halobacteriota archaeon]
MTVVRAGTGLDQLAPPMFVEISRLEITILGLIAIVILVGLSAFFSSSEIAMFKLPRHRLESLVEQQTPGARTVHELKGDPHRLLVTILVGNNVVNVAMSSIATALLALWVSQAASVALVTLVVTAFVLLFGESAPKAYAVENSESWALRIARPLKFSEQLLLPLVITFDRLTRMVNSLTGGQSTLESSYVTRSDIEDLIKTGERAGIIEEEEREMFQRLFRFNRTIAKEVMTPRLDMTAVPVDATPAEALETAVQSNHARLPVYEGSLDNVIGVIHIRDLVRDYLYGEVDPEDLDLRDLIEPTLHVPESKNVDELLSEMQERRMHMAIVIDEFGTTEGLITMEDMVEEIVGEILEGEEDIPIELLDEDTAIVQGEVNIDEVNAALDIELPEGEEFETIAGFIFNRAGRLVDEGETITFDGVDIRVEQVENTRIMSVRVTVTEREPPEATDEETAELEEG